MTDQIEIAQLMRKHGGSFAQAIGEALLHSDYENTRKIVETWPEMLDQYRTMLAQIKSRKEAIAP